MTQVLDRTPAGADLSELLTNLGLWRSGANPAGPDAPSFPTSTQGLSSDQVGTAALFWQSQLSLLQEWIGVLEAQQEMVKLADKRVRAQAATRIRAEFRAAQTEGLSEGEVAKVKVKDITKAELDERIEQAVEVIELAERALLLNVMVVAFRGYEKSYEGRCRALSREQSRQDAIMNGRGRTGR